MTELLKKCAVILAAGRGTRLAGITPPYTKTILPVAGLPIIGYGARAAEPYVDRIVVVGHHSTGEQVVQAVRDSLKNRELPVALTLQAEPLGMADAMRRGFEALEGDWAVVVIAGDNIVLDSQNVRQTLLALTTTNPDESEVELVWTYQEFEPAEARRFSVYRPGAGYHGELIEKPENPPSRICWCGPVAFSSSAEALKRVNTLQPSARGEYEAPHLINTYLRQGKGRHVPLVGPFFDVGTPEALAEAEQAIPNYRQNN